MRRAGTLGVVLLLAAACQRAAPTGGGTPGTPTGTPGTAASVAPPATWHTLGSWSGRGPAQTGSFDVGTGSLRVTWKAEPVDGRATGRFRVVLHSAISGRPLQTVVDVTGPGADTAYVQDEPRVSYFEVEAEGLAWRIAVEEVAAAPTSARRQLGQVTRVRTHDRLRLAALGNCSRAYSRNVSSMESRGAASPCVAKWLLNARLLERVEPPHRTPRTTLRQHRTLPQA